MPFVSKAQQSACYATKGFGGKVNCKEWSSKTNQKMLPAHKVMMNHGGGKLHANLHRFGK